MGSPFSEFFQRGHWRFPLLGQRGSVRASVTSDCMDTANGTVLVEELEKLAKETEFAAGYVRVRTPHLAREKMYKTSGHLPYYAESMFPKMEMDEHRADRQQLEARIAELEKQLSDYAKKQSGA